MAVMDTIYKFYYGPTFGMLISVLCSYVVVYVIALIMTRIFISLRKGRRPSIDEIANWTLLVCILICMVLPIFFIVELLAENPWHIIPFAIAILVNVMILAKLFGKLRKYRLS